MLIKRLLTRVHTGAQGWGKGRAQREKSLWVSRSGAVRFIVCPLYLAVAARDRNSIKYSCNKQGKRKFILEACTPH